MGMKTAIVKILYYFLELLPYSFANKIKMIGNIAIHNWQMDSFCMFDIRKTMDEEQAKTLFSSDDKMTGLILHHQYVLGALFIPPEFQDCFFYYHRRKLYFYMRKMLGQ